MRGHDEDRQKRGTSKIRQGKFLPLMKDCVRMCCENLGFPFDLTHWSVCGDGVFNYKSHLLVEEQQKIGIFCTFFIPSLLQHQQASDLRRRSSPSCHSPEKKLLQIYHPEGKLSLWRSTLVGI